MSDDTLNASDCNHLMEDRCDWCGDGVTKTCVAFHATSAVGWIGHIMSGCREHAGHGTFDRLADQRRRDADRSRQATNRHDRRAIRRAVNRCAMVGRRVFVATQATFKSEDALWALQDRLAA